MSELTLLPEVREFLNRQHGHFINGLPVSGKGDAYFEVVNPATEQVIAKVKEGTCEEVDAAMNAAYAAFKGSWANTRPMERVNCLNRLADLLEKH